MNRTKLFVWVGVLFIAGLVYSQTRVVTDPQTFIDELLASVLSPDAPPPFNLPLVPSNAVPAVATFWSAQANEDSPPFPFNPVADLGLPVYSLGNNSFLFDDRAVNYEAWNQMQSALRQLARGMTMDSLEFPPDGTNEFDGGWTNSYVSPVYTTNDLWLEITNYADGTAAFIIHAPVPAAYDLFGTSNLNLAVDVPALNGTNWLWLWRTESGVTNLAITNLWADMGYFRLGTLLDSDADGLTDAFEQLCSHTDLNDGDTDDDGMSDYDEVLLGRNPLAAGTAPDTGNVTGLQLFTPLQ